MCDVNGMLLTSLHCLTWTVCRPIFSFCRLHAHPLLWLWSRSKFGGVIYDILSPARVAITGNARGFPRRSKGSRFCNRQVISTQSPGAGLMNTVINYAREKPSSLLPGYGYVHDWKVRQPRQIAATMLTVTIAITYSHLYLTVNGNRTPRLRLPFTSATN